MRSKPCSQDTLWAPRSVDILLQTVLNWNLEQLFLIVCSTPVLCLVDLQRQHCTLHWLHFFGHKNASALQKVRLEGGKVFFCSHRGCERRNLCSEGSESGLEPRQFPKRYP